MRRAKEKALRPGVALLMTLVILSVVSLVLGVITLQILAQRRQLEQRQHQLQASWLARSGLEIARTRLLASGTPFKQEMLTLLPESEVRISLEPKKASPDAFILTSAARYLVDLPAGGVVRTLTQKVRRVVDGSTIRLEVLSGAVENP